MGNDGLSSKQVGSQASRRVTRRLAWIQPVCISINAVPALKGLRYSQDLNKYFIWPVVMKKKICKDCSLVAMAIKKKSWNGTI